ncbi:pyridoxamine 5'-phosphate oxidase family protein [bacterium]|nr:pyridoxamine 5'-phosphate oxidase family protein [bacterium]
MTDRIYPPTERSTIKRRAKRAAYDREVVHAILDEGLVGHVGFVADGQPFVIPMAYARIDETLYLHGAAASRLLRTLRAGADVCLSVTLLDGLVLARSAFHHSMNYRSVVVFGQASLVEDESAKREALRALTEHLTPGRWEVARQPSSAELAGTMVLALPIAEASAKIRTGGPVDDEDDYALPVWAGVVPLKLTMEAPVPDSQLAEGVSFTGLVRP